MSLRILFVADPLESFNIHKDTTFAMMEAAQQRGWTCFEAQVSGLTAHNGVPHARSARVTVQRKDPPNHFTRDAWDNHALSGFDAIIMRKDPPVDAAYTTALWLLDLTDRRRTQVLNEPKGILAANEKVYALRFPEFIPDTLVSSRSDDVVAFYRDMGQDIILKPLDGHGGLGILRVTPGDRNLRSMIELLTLDGKRCLMAQRYLPAARLGDKRILLVDGEPLGAVLRVPSEEDNRGNMHVGGQAQPTDITAREREMCAALGPQLRKDGLTFVGIDVIGERLTEVNVTSPTGAQEIARFTGNNAAARLMDVIGRRANGGTA
jgi:glutathione synthase